MIGYLKQLLENENHIVSNLTAVDERSGQKQVYFADIDNIACAIKIVDISSRCSDLSELEDEERKQQEIILVRDIIQRTINEINMTKEYEDMPQLKIWNELKQIEKEGDIYLCYIEERLQGKTLAKYNSEYSIIEVLDFIYQMLELIIKMSSIGYVHRDIKPSNIIVYKNKYRLIDGGLCKNIKDENDYTKYIIRMGTERYCPPEQEKIRPNTNWTYKTDLFPLGIIATEMFVPEARLLLSKDLKDLSIMQKMWLNKEDNEDIKEIFKNVIVVLSHSIPAMRSNNLEDLKKYIKTKMKGSENI
jgi:serine/threonine-protein kinase